MSSTKRGGQRRPNDFYATPRWAIESLLADDDWWGIRTPILEPGCGDGAILKVLKAHEYGPLIGVEQHPGRAEQAAPHCDRLLVTDFLTGDLSGIGKIGCVIGNPPYSDAEAFVRRSLEIVDEGCDVFLLLRLAFLAGQRRERGGLWENLSSVRVLAKRPSFTGAGNDSADYAWIGWRRPGEHARIGRPWIRVLGAP